jgi:hypothetical protein
VARRQPPPPFEVPEWLTNLAAEDDRPTVIDRGLVARLERLGATKFVAFDRLRPLPDDEAAGANAIAVELPANTIVSSLENIQTPIRASLEELRDFAERFDTVTRLHLAAVDMRLVEETAQRLAGATAATGCSRPVFSLPTPASTCSSRAAALPA